MSNIIGEGFNQAIKLQVEKRQEKLGILENIGDDILTWYNAKNAWIRLASSVDIDGNSNLAKTNVLFGGTLTYQKQDNKEIWSFKDEFDFLNPTYSSSTYSNGMLGFRPMANIVDVKVDYLNRGSLRKAEIRIKAYSIEQLEILDKLYLKPGYSILLEWGHSIYINNNGEKETFNTFSTVPFNLFFKQGKVFQDILDSIKDEKIKYFGNYEAFCGKITNFVWDFNIDGTYDITLTAISFGDIIESLKINNSLENNNSQQDEVKKENKPYLEMLKDITSFNRFLYEASHLPEDEVKKKYNLINKNLKLIQKAYVGDKSWFFGSRKSNNQYYITLGGLLEYLEKNQNLIISENKKSLYLKYDYDYNNNYCLTFPGHFSSDPTVCLIPVIDLIDKTIIQNDLSDFNVTDNLYVGKLMFILLNMEFLSSLFFSLRNEEDGNVNLFDFLKNILLKINNSLGNINKLNIFYDSEENQIRIIEEAPLKYGALKTTKKEEYTKLNIFGVQQNNGSFVKDVNFNVAISKDIMTNITIGASSNGNQPGENATGFAFINKNLKDRTAVVKIPTTDARTSEDVNVLPQLKYKRTVQKLNESLKDIYINKNLTDDTIKVIESLSSDYFKYNIGYLSTKQIPSPVFLPFNLNLKMMGLGGMKIYQKFLLSDNSLNILPSSYKDGRGQSVVDFLITKISHVIKDNKWETEITALTAPSELDELVPIPTTVNNFVEGLRQEQQENTLAPTNDRENCNIKEIPKTVKYLTINEVVQFFIGKGYSKQAASSLTANLLSESGLNLNAFNPSGGGCGAYGLAQWRSGRQNKLYDYSKQIGKAIDDKDTQLNYIINELNKNEISVKLKLTNAQTLEAANLAATSYERFEGYNNPQNSEVLKRLEKTKQIYNQLV